MNSKQQPCARSIAQRVVVNLHDAQMRARDDSVTGCCGAAPLNEELMGGRDQSDKK
jgi:hypothetical protein